MQQGARFTVGVVLALSLAGFLQAGLQYPSGEDAPLSTSFAPPGIAPAAVTTTTFPAAADAYIESGGNANRNFGAAQWLGVGYDALSAINPGLVMVSITPLATTASWPMNTGQPRRKISRKMLLDTGMKESSTGSGCPSREWASF